jgi:1,4-alpha-glucan branching enzyme
MAAGTDSMEKSMNTEFNHFLFNSGEHLRSYEFMGAHVLTIDGVSGVQFTVWAPNARLVHLSGDFNSWAKTDMKLVGAAGIWSVFLPGITEGTAYKYIIVTQDGRELYKSDPYAFWSEGRPKTASVIKDLKGFQWTDEAFYEAKRANPIKRSPVNIYELHAGSWKRHWDGRYFTYSELAADLVPYVREMGYTHIELMPLMEHPLDDSWGYQITGYFSATSRFGEPKELMAFVDKCHEEGIGVIMDWVPAHFCRDAHGLYMFDGTPTYEYQDPNKANNNRWGTTHFDFGKSQVQTFLISNAIFWLEMYHIDGLRVDAVSSMLYLDYDDGPWTPNIYGGNTNLEAVDFLKKLNKKVLKEYPEALMIAEESTAFPKITHPVKDGGLGFTFKWNMGWMNDTLKYFSLDPMYRKYHHNLITFSFMYIFSENFMLALSHDEVVHGKGSLLNKMPGDERMKFAGLRTLMAYMMCHPGKKLNFMGSEIAQWLEWRFREGLEWVALQHETHQKHIAFMKELNQIYLERKCLHEIDDSYDGIDILDADNKDHSLFTFIRYARDRNDFLIVACNFTPVQRDDVRIGVPFEGDYAELLNTELEKHGGTWKYSKDKYTTDKVPQDKKQYSIQVILPPLSVLIIEPKKIKEVTI